MTRTLVLALTLVAAPLMAQQSPLVGSWQVTYPAGVRVEGGSTTFLTGTGSLTIEAQGDSLIATLVADPVPDRPSRPPLRMAAAAGQGERTFIGHSTATLQTNGESREATVVSTWKLGVQGDSLQGTVERRLEGFDAPGQGPRPVTGTRRQG